MKLKHIRRIIFIITIINFVSTTFGQEIEIDGIYASSSSKKFKNSFGYGLRYNQYIKSKNRLSVSLSQYFYNTHYDDIYSSTIDGISKFIKEVKPNNQRIALKINYSFRLIDNPKSNFYLGPEISLNYFMICEQYDRIANGDISGGHFSSDYSVNNRPGIGFLIEFELKEIISKRISISLSIHPEITSFEEFPAMGSHDPWFIGWLNFNFGIRFNLIKDQCAQMPAGNNNGS